VSEISEVSEVAMAIVPFLKKQVSLNIMFHNLVAVLQKKGVQCILRC